MPSSLPTELLRQIIESTAPSRYHTLTYAERQRTLLRLCLVSHRFRQIAQPLLRQVICFSGAERLSKLVFDNARSPQGWGLYVVEAVLKPRRSGYSGIPTVEQLAATFPNLARLAIWGIWSLSEPFDLRKLPRFAGMFSARPGYSSRLEAD